MSTTNMKKITSFIAENTGQIEASITMEITALANQLKADGKPIGEFRSNGSQTVIKGIHPSECLYEIIHRASPIELNYADLNFGEHEKNTHTHLGTLKKKRT